MHQLARVALLSLFAPLAAAQAWIVNPANGHLYGVGPNTTSWAAGEQFAASLNGHLATIRSASEQAWIQANFGAYLGNNGLWIGFNDIAIEGQWVWASGEPVTYTNWAPGQPDNGSGNEDGGHLFGAIGGPSQWMWNDETDTFSTIMRPLIELVPASYTSFGVGCLGPNGQTPLLTGIASEPPRMGTTTRMRVSNLPLAVTIPVFVVGESNTQNLSPSYPLPLDLGVLGWPGCPQLVSNEVSTFAITLSGQADYTLAVPVWSALLGYTFHAQALVLYTPTGVAVSNGVTGTVGY